MARHVILDHYLAVSNDLMERLSPSAQQAQVSPSLVEAIEQYGRLMPWVAPANKTRADEEKYRRFLDYVLERLRRTREGTSEPHSYQTPEEYAADLKLIYESLATNC